MVDSDMRVTIMDQEVQMTRKEVLMKDDSCNTPGASYSNKGMIGKGCFNRVNACQNNVGVTQQGDSNC